MIKDFSPRLYQEKIFSTAAKQNTLVVLPTGMGKTGIALLLAAHRLSQYPASKILILAPTKPLAQQLCSVLEKHLQLPEHPAYQDQENRIVLFTGAVPPQKRKQLYQTAQIIASTPQTIENDILAGSIDLKAFSLVVFDEAHRAVGDYAYGYIAKTYLEVSPFPRILALTASPGSEMEKTMEIIQQLHIEAIEVRTEDDPDVLPYIQPVEMTWKEVLFPESFMEIKNRLLQYIKEKLEKVKEKGYIHQDFITNHSKKELLGLQAKLREEMLAGKNFDAMKSISLVAEVIKIEHAIELLETQGIPALYLYLEKLEREGYQGQSKAAKEVVKDLNFRTALLKTKALFLQGIQHPKLEVLLGIVSYQLENNPQTKIIIFNQYRDNAKVIVEEVNKLPNAKAKLFVGQAKKNGSGLSQKEQLQILDAFKAGEFNILVSSSVGEEGLDIPAVELVIFYEPIPSAIRHIQRRGRTARLQEGSVIVLVTKGTRDEMYRWSSHHKEKRMHRNLGQLQKTISIVSHERNLQQQKHIPLDAYEKKEQIAIIIDHREASNQVTKQLKLLDCD
ncbi:MAG: helicase-related protein, partial [Candidatus Woesearchaeota archaeon]